MTSSAYEAAKAATPRTMEEWAARRADLKRPVRLPPNCLQQRAEFYYSVWLVDLAESWQHGLELEDLFRPETWVPFGEKKLKPLDLIRIISRDRSWDFFVTVDAVVGQGVSVRPFGVALPGSPLAMLLGELMGPAGPAAQQQAATDAEIAGMGKAGDRQ